MFYDLQAHMHFFHIVTWYITNIVQRGVKKHWENGNKIDPEKFIRNPIYKQIRTFSALNNVYKNFSALKCYVSAMNFKCRLLFDYISINIGKLINWCSSNEVNLLEIYLFPIAFKWSCWQLYKSSGLFMRFLAWPIFRLNHLTSISSSKTG